MNPNRLNSRCLLIGCQFSQSTWGCIFLQRKACAQVCKAAIHGQNFFGLGRACLIFFARSERRPPCQTMLSLNKLVLDLDHPDWLATFSTWPGLGSCVLWISEAIPCLVIARHDITRTMLQKVHYFCILGRRAFQSNDQNKQRNKTLP